MPYLLTNDLAFPNPRNAWQDPQGLIAVGGDLSPARLKLAYELGIFPWYSEQDPILWWSPDPRTVLFLDDLKLSRSLKKSIRNKGFKAYLNRDFESVIQHCAEIRSKDGTWITQDMLDAYITLHQLGMAHCVSVYQDNNLVGGLYGPSLGKFFFGESMFSIATDASKVALFYLVKYLKQHDFVLIDCQMPNDHLATLGCRDISRENFLDLIERDVYHEQGDIWRPQQLTVPTDI